MGLAGGCSGQCWGREQTERSQGYICSQRALFMRMLFARGCRADGNCSYRLSSRAAGVKTKLSLHASALMRSASPGCVGTGGGCSTLALELVTAARKKKRGGGRKRGPVVCTGLEIPSSHASCSWPLPVWRGGLLKMINVMVQVPSPHSPASAHEQRRHRAHTASSSPLLRAEVGAHGTCSVSPRSTEQLCYRNRAPGLAFLAVFFS